MRKNKGKKPIFKTYIKRVFKEVNPQMKLTTTGRKVIEGITVDIMDRVCDEIDTLAQMQKAVRPRREKKEKDKKPKKGEQEEKKRKTAKGKTVTWR